jgi:hypothetical protein
MKYRGRFIYPLVLRFNPQPSPPDIIRPQGPRGWLKLGTNIARIAVLLCLPGTATAAAADENNASVGSYDNDMAWSVKAGTLGIVVDTTRYVSDRVNYRIWLSQSVNALNDVGRGPQPPYATYSYDYMWQTLGALLDWHPLGGPFRMSAGLLLNNNNTYIEADISDGYYFIGRHTYPATGVSQPQGKLSYRHFAAYIGVGWGNAQARNRKWTFAGDVGLLYQGKPSVTLNATGNAPGLQDDLAIERADIRSTRGFWWPVLSFGIGYKW